MFQSSFNETDSFLETSPRSQVSQTFFTHHSHITTSLDFEVIANQWQQKQPTYEISKVLVFKGIPEDMTEIELLTMCQPFGLVKDILTKKQKRYAFIQFERVEQAQKCYESFNKLPPTIHGQVLQVLRTGKDTIAKPSDMLDLPSRYVLIGFNKSGLNIDSGFIAQLLISFGKCLKIAIFQGKNTQAFIEMEDVLQAIRVKENLDGQYVFGTICIDIMYTEEKEMLQRANMTSNFGLSTMETLEQMPLSQYVTTSNNSFSNLWNEPKTNPSCVWPNAVGFEKPVSFSQDLSNYNKKMPPKPFSLNHEKQFSAPKDFAPYTINSMKSSAHAREEKSETILLVRNLPRGVTAKMLFRLFGMYGNVFKVKIFFKNPENALVEYQTGEQADLAKSYLNNCLVYGTNIFVTNSKQGVVVDTSSLKKGEENQYMGDFSNSPEHRYKFSGSKNHMNIVPPSKVLHLSNLCEDKEEEFYFELFKDYGAIKKFTFLTGIDRMALMEMNSINDSVNILMNFHNFNIQGKYLKVSFSKYQKIKDF